jgi:hypothetical protein
MIAMQRAHPRIAVLSGLAVLLLLPQACSDPSQPPIEPVVGQPAAVVAVEGNPTTGTVNTTLSTAPGVRVTDQHGNPVANVLVTFTPEPGSGTVSGGSQATAANGVARPASWTLGPTAGEQRLTARAVELTATITVTALPAPFAKFAGDNTTCPVNTAHCFFTVTAATVENGTPMVGQSITWTTPEGATLVTTTNAKGRTTAPNLTVRATPGSATQKARLDSTGDEVTFNFQVVQGGGYNLDIRFVGEISSSRRAIFESAAARWEQVITGDLTPINVPAGVVSEGACGIPHPAVAEVIDDLIIFVMVDSIDHFGNPIDGNKLGTAGPCFVRSSNTLPVIGIMLLDSADIGAMEANGTLYDVILHELGHVIGFATIWDDLGLITGAGGSDPFFTGARANRASS